METPKPTVHYEANVCGGSFESVLDRFEDWKREPLVSRPERRMFEGKDSVRRLGDEAFDSPDKARHALIRSCAPRDRFALAAPILDDDHCMWLVMAAFEA